MRAGERAFIAELNGSVDETVVVHGWATAVKPKGASFVISLRDRSGTASVVGASDESGSAWKDIPPESALRVVGVVRAGDTRSHSIEIVAEAITVLAPACTPLPAVKRRNGHAGEDML